MDFKQLEAFVYVVKLKSFSKAAQQIYLTQPTISAHINSLERELGTKLIERDTKTVYPTKSGTILFQYAEKMMNLREEAMCAVRSHNKEQGGVLNICASSIPSQYILPKIMASFREEYPKVVFQMQRQDSGKVIESIQQHNAEIGFLGMAGEEKDLVFEEFATDRLVIITPNEEKYRKMNREDFDRDLLRHLPVVIRERGSGTRKEMEHFLHQAGIDLTQMNIAAQFDDPDTIKHAVSQGLGISVISECAVEDYVNFGQILPFHLSDLKMERGLYMVYRKNAPMSVIGEIFLDFVRMYFHKEEE